MKKIIALALAIFMTLALCACGGDGGNSGGDDSVLGKYELYAMDYDENNVVLTDELFDGENYIVLKSGGKAEMCLEDEKSDVKWKLDGKALVLKADDGDMEGTLSKGIITLELDGSNLYFVGESGSKSKLNAKTLDELLHGIVDDPGTDNPVEPGTDEPTEPVEPQPTETASEVQKLWNGWYYGCLDINGSEGGWEAANGLTFDAAMQVELDADGSGTLTIYDPYGAFALNPEHNNRYVVINCHADTSYLYGDSGTAFDYDINTSDWRVVRNTANQNKLNVGSSYTDAYGNKLGYDFTFLPWGDRWESESYSQFIPHFDDYLDMLDKGMNNPFDDGSAPETPSTPSTPSSGGLSPLLGSSPTKLDINDRGIAFVYYPADQFVYDDWYGKLKNEATGVGILMDPMLGSTNFDELKESYKENNSDEDDYSLVETTVNGYKALILKYSDWLGSTMRVDIDFGGNHDGWYGISFAVSGDSLADCDTDLIWAIIESLEVS